LYITNKKKEVISMVHVVVMVRVKEGRAKEFIDLFKSVAGKVSGEKGCIQYIAATDAVGAPPDTVDKNVVTVLERWESVEDINVHMGTPHMKDFFEKQKELVEGISGMKVLQEA
jgi:quinol monooxygenase YgiN